MIDPVSFFTVVSAAGSGLVGNTAYAAAVHLIPQVQRWYKGEGQPVNHHLQRALRSAYLSATRDALKQAGTRAPSIFDDTSAWCARALEWVQAQSHLLKDESYHPPAPPGGWEPAHLAEPSAADAASEVSALRDGLRAMLLGEWAAENLRTPPAPVLAALGEPWFDSISLYFAQELKRLPQTEAIFHAGIESKILIELRALRREVAAGRGSEGAPAFFAPASPDYFVGREAALEILGSRLAEPGAVVPLGYAGPWENQPRHHLRAPRAGGFRGRLLASMRGQDSPGFGWRSGASVRHFSRRRAGNARPRSSAFLREAPLSAGAR